MNILLRLFINTLAVLVADYLIVGVEVDGLFTALVVALVIGLLNTFIRPILYFLTLPINLLTLGLFSLILNAIIIIIASYIVPGFIVGTLIDAVLFGLALSIISSVLGVAGKH